MTGEIKIKYALTTIAIVIAAPMLACTIARWIAPEYKQQYYLSEDVNKYSSYIVTGFYSLWVTGPEKVETICSSNIPVATSTLLKKGSPVRILKIFKVFTIESSHTDAKLQIFDAEAKSTHIVYIKWPGSKALLTTEPPTSVNKL